MACFDAEGFELRDLTALTSAGWTFDVGTSISTSDTHVSNGNGSRACLVFGNNTSINSRVYGSGTNARWFSCAAKISSGGGSLAFAFMPPGGGITPNFEVRFTAVGGQVALYRGSTLLFTSVASFPYDQWIWIDIELTSQNAGGVCNVYIGTSGVTIATFAGDTQNTVTAGWNSVRMDSGLGIAQQRLDDVICNDNTTGRVPGEVFGYSPDIDAEAAAPAPVGTWTPTGAATNWEAVATKPLQTAIYTEDPATAGALIFFEKAPVPWTPTSIFCAKGSVYSARDGTVTGVEVGVSDGVTDYSSVLPMGGAGAFVLNEYVLLLDPDTGAAWTLAGFDAAKPGSRYS